MPLVADAAPARGAPDRAPTRRTRPDRFWFGLALISLAGLLWRVVYVLVWKRPTLPCGLNLCGDELYYAAQAEAVADGRWFEDPFRAGFPAADHPPLHVLVLAPVDWVTGHRLVAMRLFVAVLGTLAIVLIGLLGRHVGRTAGPPGARGGDRVGLLAAALAALNANLWMNDALLMSETLATVLVVGTLLALYRYLDAPSAGRAALVGLSCGLTVLTRAEMALLLPVAFLPLALTRRELSWRRRLGQVAVTGAVTIAVLAPWVVYNLGRFQEPVLLSTNEGTVLIGAYNDDVFDGDGVGFWSLWPVIAARDETLARNPDADQSVISNEQRDRAIEYLRSHERRLPAVMLIRFARVWGIYAPDQTVFLNTGEGRERWASWIGVWSWWVLAPLAVLGAVCVHRRRQVSIWPLVSTAIIVSLTAVVFYGIVRFRLPADIAATVLAAAGLDAAWRWATGRRSRAAGTRTAGAAR